MRFFLVLCSFSLLSFQSVYAQSFFIKGFVTTAGGQPASNAYVELLKPRDSSVVKGTVTDAKGIYQLSEVKSGFYIIRISSLGFETHYGRVKVGEADVFMDKVILVEAAQSLEGVKAKADAKPVSQKGDTSEYKAGAYKTNPDANAEDLVSKMPGVTNTNGKVQVQGEDVKVVLVDGKPFFGDDPSAVLKNLPAEAIDKVQVFDQKSTQSQFTGFDDGNTSKTINIITKAQYKNGTFGKVYGGYGYEDKYRSGASINAFKNERKISFLFNSNNVNEQNFSADDLLGVMSTTGGGGNTSQMPRGGGGNRGGNPGGGGGPQNSSENFLTNNKNGLVTTHSFGLNYTNKWNKVSLTGSYFFNYSNSNASTSLYRTYITGYSEGLLYNENSQNITKNTNQRANLKLEWKIDSFNSILFQPRGSMQNSEVEQVLGGVNTYNSQEISSLKNIYESAQKGMNISAPILYRHSFLKKGRTFSLNATPGYSESSGDNRIFSLIDYSDTLSDDTLNQMSDMAKEGFTMSTNLTYTEPVSKNAQLVFNYTGNLNYNNSDKLTNQFVPSDNAYTKFDTLLSNTFKSQYTAHGAGVNYNYRKDKLNFSFGGNYQSASLHVNSVYPESYTSTTPFVNFLPTAMLMYRYTQQKNLRLFYRTSTNVPGVDQLQAIINNNNPLQLTAGNPDLKQDYQNSLNIRYSSADTKKNTSFFAMVGGTVTNNYIANSVFIASADTMLNERVLLARGSQISQPVNLQGYFSLRSFANYSFVIKKIKSNMNINAFGGVVRTPSVINNATNYAYSDNMGLVLSLSSNISKDFDFTLSSNSSYYTISNTLQKQLNSEYFNQNLKLKIQAMPWKGLILQTDFSRQFYIGLSETVNTDYMLWNAGIGYKFMKDKQAEFRLIVFDLLNQNTSLNRNTTETYYEDVRTNILQRYFMLNFTYNIKYFKQTTLPPKP